MERNFKYIGADFGQYVMVVLVFVVGLLIFGHSFSELAVFSIKRSTYNYILIIPIASGYIFWINRKEIFYSVSRSNWLGFSIIGSGVLIYWINRFLLYGQLSEDDTLIFTILGGIVYLFGFFILIFGVKSFRAALFPLLFLLFLVPLPSGIYNPFVRLLQVGSAEMAAFFFSVAGVPVLREGAVFTLTGATIEVAEQCSGIRSALALIILSTVAGYTFLNSNWRRLLLVLAVTGVAIVKNGLRIAVLGLMGSYVDIGYITHGSLHRQGGKPFFIIGAAVMVGILWLLKRSERKIESFVPEVDNQQQE